MMVPSHRLLGLVALVLTPALTAISLGGGLFHGGLLIAVGAVGLAILDGVLSLDRLRGLTVSVDSPIHAIVGRPFDLQLRLSWETRGRPWLTVEFDVPSELEPIAFPQRTQLVPKEAGSNGASEPLLQGSLKGQSRVLERGRHALQKLHAETGSWLGLWWIRREITLDLAVHGYPDLHPDRRLLAARTTAQQAGLLASQLGGRGRAFDRLRDYVPGDELGDIHWRATAKRRRPITKLYQLEKDQRIYVAIDQSRLSSRASPRECPAEERPLSLLERYVNSALVLGSVAQSQGDQFGLLGFSDRVTSFTLAGSGPAHYKACREAILEFRTQRVNADYRELLTFFCSKVRRRSMLFILTSVDDPALSEELVQSAHLIADRHLVVAAAVTPASARSLAEAEPIDDPGQITEKLAAHLVWKQLRQTARQLGQTGVRFLPLNHQTLVPHLVGSYARIKRGQLL